jgi:hypothetical protein
MQEVVLPFCRWLSWRWGILRIQLLQWQINPACEGISTQLRIFLCGVTVLALDITGFMG